MVVVVAEIGWGKQRGWCGHHKGEHHHLFGSGLNLGAASCEALAGEKEKGIIWQVTFWGVLTKPYRILNKFEGMSYPGQVDNLAKLHICGGWAKPM